MTKDEVSSGIIQPHIVEMTQDNDITIGYQGYPHMVRGCIAAYESEDAAGMDLVAALLLGETCPGPRMRA